MLVKAGSFGALAWTNMEFHLVFIMNKLVTIKVMIHETFRDSWRRRLKKIIKALADNA